MEKQIFFRRVLPLFTLSLILMTAGCIAGIAVPEFTLPVSIVFFVTLLLTYILKHIRGINLIVLFILVFSGGFLLSSIVTRAILTGNADAVMIALSVTTLVFIVSSAVSLIFSWNLGWMGSTLSYSLLSLIILSFVSIFIDIEHLDFILSLISTVLFSGYFFYDMNRIIGEYDEDEYIDAVVSLYLDFLNLFQSLLTFILYMREEE